MPFSESSGSTAHIKIGENLAHSRRTIAKFAGLAAAADRPLFPPCCCQVGGAPRANRRFLWREIRHSAALPVLATRQLGGNIAPR